MPEEKQLIQPAPVVRDEYGMFQHPDLPDFDEGDGEKCKAWIAKQGLEIAMVSLDGSRRHQLHPRQPAADRQPAPALPARNTTRTYTRYGAWALD